MLGASVSTSRGIRRVHLLLKEGAPAHTDCGLDLKWPIFRRIGAMPQHRM